LLTLGFSSSKADPSLFVYRHASHTIYLLVYVDDILITGSSNSLVRHITLEYFLGIEIHYLSGKSLMLTQSKYLRDLLHHTHMVDAHPVPTPMVSSAKLSKSVSSAFVDPTLFRSVVGALQYVTLTRPDVSYDVNKVC